MIISLLLLIVLNRQRGMFFHKDVPVELGWLLLLRQTVVCRVDSRVVPVGKATAAVVYDLRMEVSITWGCKRNTS